jgi:hypothetical protein
MLVAYLAVHGTIGHNISQLLSDDREQDMYDGRLMSVEYCWQSHLRPVNFSNPKLSVQLANLRQTRFLP